MRPVPDTPATRGGRTTTQRAMTPLLHRACKAGHHGAVRGLLLHGADTTDVDELAGWSALHYASFYGAALSAQLLLDHGADVNATDRYGTSALHLAARTGADDVARVLVENGANVCGMTFSDASTPLHEAAFFGHAGVVKRLIDSGVELSLRDTVCGQTPLHWAAGNGHVECVVWLVRGWADVFVRDRAGNSPLHCAVLGPDAARAEKIVRLLVRAGALLQTVERNLDGNTPLCMARSAALGRVLEAYMRQGYEVQHQLAAGVIINPPPAVGAAADSPRQEARGPERAP